MSDDIFVEGGWYTEEEIKRAAEHAGISEEDARRLLRALGAGR